MYFRCADAGIVKKWQPENDEKNQFLQQTAGMMAVIIAQ